MITHIYKYIDDSCIHCYTIEYLLDNIKNTWDIIMNLININESYSNFNKLDFIEYGPYLEMISPWCTNALNILNKCNIYSITRIEKSLLVHKDIYDNSMLDPMTQRIYTHPISTFGVLKEIKEMYEVKDIDIENEKYKLGFDEQDIKFYKTLIDNMGRNFTNIELHDLAQSNSEHSRHWFFNGKFIKDGINMDESLMKMIKNTLSSLQNNNNNNNNDNDNNNKKSTIAFSDNSSSFEGYDVKTFYPNIMNKFYQSNTAKYNPVFTAETHNFPTSVAPFPGAATGTGGRIRDSHSVGRGGLCIAGIAGYSVGNIHQSQYKEKNIKTLIEASNGASDYGNKFGEPIIQGFCRSFGMTFDNDERIEYVKPIMLSGGIGQMNDIHTFKDKNLDENILVIRIGGPCYRIGIGGGAASSRDQKTENMQQDFDAVQRGDPEMENKLNRVIRTCIELEENNPILSIHDQGAGGMANVTKEIIYPNGGKINLKNVIVGDNTMSVLEIWISEHQEQDTILVHKYDLKLLESICKREALPISVIGNINNNGKIIVEYDGKKVVEFDLEPILGKTIPRKVYKLTDKIPYLIKNNNLINNTLFHDQSLITLLRKVLGSISVCSKRFLVNKVDRSVTGLIAQQQCCGILQTPLTDYSIVAQSYFNLSGITTAIGERPIVGLLDPVAMARMSIGEMLTNIIFCKIDSIHNIRCSGNWMWPMKLEGEKDRLYKAVKAMCDCMLEIGIALDGGKDSLSMSYQDHIKNKTIKAPGTLVISGYTPCSDIRNKVTPDFKECNSHIYYINLSDNKYRLGGSILYQEYDQLGNINNCPNFENIKLFKYVFNQIQKMIEENIILSGHDVSDGGMITSLMEMCFAGNLGFRGRIKVDVDHLNFLFAEELGIIIEVNGQQNVNKIEEIFDKSYCYYLGQTHEDNKFEFSINDINQSYKIDHKVNRLRKYWEETSYQMELLQTNPICAKLEYKKYSKWLKRFIYETYNNNIIQRLNQIDLNQVITIRPNVAIIREEGSNGDREMAAVFYSAGFDVYDITMNDFINDDISLDKFRGIALVGGFSYSDVFGAARGWYQVIMNNLKIKKQFDRFYNREDVFSIGICNGCQLLSLLGWIPDCKLVENKSKRFESRFSRVKINNSRAMMLQGMEESILGIWVAHHEGRFMLDHTVHPDLISLQYVDYDDKVTIDYPQNPNGSELGIAGMCSEDGMHLGMMPHPERCYLEWQKPINSSYDKTKYSGWYLMFKNAYEWCKSI